MLTIEQIQERLSDRNLAEVARRLNVTRAYISALKNGKVKPSYPMLTKLSHYLEGNQ